MPQPPYQTKPTGQPQELCREGRRQNIILPRIVLTNDTGGVGSDEGMVQGLQKQIPVSDKGYHSNDCGVNCRPIPASAIQRGEHTGGDVTLFHWKESDLGRRN